MTFQAYIDNVKTKTGKSPGDFRKLAARQKLSKFGEVRDWLKSDFALGHGHATAIAHLVVNGDTLKAPAADKLAAHFAGGKSVWRKPFDDLAMRLRKIGGDVELAPNRTYINVQKAGRKFAIVQVSAADRLDIGLKMKGVAPTARLESAEAWNAMVTHRVKVFNPGEIDTALIKWLKQAYEMN